MKAKPIISQAYFADNTNLTQTAGDEILKKPKTKHTQQKNVVNAIQQEKTSV